MGSQWKLNFANRVNISVILQPYFSNYKNRQLVEDIHSKLLNELEKVIHAYLLG